MIYLETNDKIIRRTIPLNRRSHIVKIYNGTDLRLFVSGFEEFVIKVFSGSEVV